ncbi:enoyl-CoA hydratase [Jatrophihabitans sp. GAS493]|uniref:enoyl-CoA hydratase-related protein n=1 Tax=Jatrophihabitans sp. GAS493 TaxID=1907575 RepID=UPI000BB7040D|nr:enoyl-CoA hydratase-related protein [Jatrophihabitans sp. GAS493]SOD71762.1 enoyl-CoA hydratase [Jatrophihabitans sp. GAS493]
MTPPEETGFEHLRWERAGAIATVYLARPPVNSVSQAMYREIRRLFADITLLGAGVKVIILTGAGRHFCGGNDLQEFATLSAENSEARMSDVRAAFFAVQEAPIPVIAAVHGVALGTGLALAASCDFVVAADTARFGTPEIGVGIMGGARHLARLVPEAWVRWMYLSGDAVSAEQLLRLGGVVAVVPEAELLTAAHEHAARIARHSSALIRMAKRSLDTIENLPLQQGYTFEQSLTALICADPDSQEAVRATLQRRPPNYPSER